jgi:hypothetical protein
MNLKHTLRQVFILVILVVALITGFIMVPPHTPQSTLGNEIASQVSHLTKG